MTDLNARQRIAETLLDSALDADGFAPCPGRDKHTSRAGRRDFRVMLEGAPTGTCFHASCAAEVEAFNLELRRRIARAESGHNGEHGTGATFGADVARLPQPQRTPKHPPFDKGKLESFAARCPRAVSLAWLRACSPVPVAEPKMQGRETALHFLRTLYGPSEPVLIFTKQWSQGDFIWQGERGTFRLGDAPRVDEVASPLPRGGSEGVWFLCQPVTGEWCVNPYASNRAEAPKLGRRHGGCVTAWRYLVLESDVADAATWLRALVLLPLPISAIYTSGGKSIHALVRVDAECKASWDDLRNALLPVLCPLGADAAAMTAVRLSRLPGMFRHGTRNKEGQRIAYDPPRLQELAWLNPEPSALPIAELVN
jgi:hypothetical protein